MHNQEMEMFSEAAHSCLIMDFGLLIFSYGQIGEV